MTPRDDLQPVLAALAAEIARAEAAAADIEDGAGRLIAAGNAAGTLSLQGLDRLRQSLGDLAAFAAVLAGTASGSVDLAPALATVTGRDVARRLAHEPSDAGGDEFWDF